MAQNNSPALRLTEEPSSETTGVIGNGIGRWSSPSLDLATFDCHNPECLRHPKEIGPFITIYYYVSLIALNPTLKDVKWPSQPKMLGGGQEI